MLTTAAHGGDASPAATSPPSRLHNFDLKSWGKRRLNRRCTNLKARKPTVQIEKQNPKARKPTVQIEEENLKARKMTVQIESVERRGFCVSLTKEEIEEDFVAMKGAKPSRRPKKRARSVQRLIEVAVTM